MNQTEELNEVHLTVKEAARYIEESPGVVRNWLRELKTHIPVKQGKKRLQLF